MLFLKKSVHDGFFSSISYIVNTEVALLSAIENNAPDKVSFVSDELTLS